jgi:hypothetical protein
MHATMTPSPASENAMLDAGQWRHFSDHGWVLLPGALAPERCGRLRAAIDRAYRVRRPLDAKLGMIDHLVSVDQEFIDWLRLPGLLGTLRGLMDCAPRYCDSHARITAPHPEREQRAAALSDPATFAWHRGIRPKFGVSAHERDAALINTAFVNVITYLPPVAPGAGGTAVLDGSHRIRDGGRRILDGSHALEGSFATLSTRCPVVEMTAPAGSLLVFTESLIHAAVPITAASTRYFMTYSFVPRWWAYWPPCEVARNLADALSDQELGALLGRFDYTGQDPEPT